MDSSKEMKVEFENSAAENFQYRYIAELIDQQEQFLKDGPPNTRIQYLECHTCKKHCLSKEKLIEHLKQHELEIHKCSLCERRFVSKNSLSYHTKSHAGIKYECDICNRKFNDKSNMKKHRNIHLNIRKYKCTLCPKAFSDPNGFKYHLEIHAGVRFKCDFCEKTYAARPTLKNHIQSVHLNMNVKFQCEICSVSFGNGEAKREHNNRVHLDVNFECHLCQKTFYLKSQLKEHIVSHVEMHLKCGVCGKLFDSHAKYGVHRKRHWAPLKCPHCPMQTGRGRTVLNAHVRDYHTNPNHCAICGKFMSSKLILKRHLLRHRGINPCKGKRSTPKRPPEMECFTCGKKFNNKTTMIDHLGRVHLQTDPIPCDICDYVSFSSRSRYHHETDHPSMKYECNYCMEPFLDHNTVKRHLIEEHHKLLPANGTWKNHVQISVYENKFKCNICAERFASKKVLSVHIESTHFNVWHTCQPCGKTFRYFSALRQHAQVHEGVKYKCAACGKCFDALFILSRHIRLTKCLKRSSQPQGQIVKQEESQVKPEPPTFRSFNQSQRMTTRVEGQSGFA